MKKIAYLRYYWVNLLHTDVDYIGEKCFKDGTWFLYYDLQNLQEPKQIKDQIIN